MSAKKTEGSIRQKRKAVIFQAAKAEFVTFGFKGASIKRIAERADIPRANIHYYFADKTDLYQQLLAEILQVWNTSYDTLQADRHPKQALTDYIKAKVLFSQQDPDASRIFASEIIHGAPIMNDYLNGEFKQWVDEKVTVIQGWVDAGQLNQVNPYHLLFLIWSSTQHYADFNSQVTAALGKKELQEQDYLDVVDSLTQIILKGCGVEA